MYCNKCHTIIPNDETKCPKCGYINEKEELEETKEIDLEEVIKTESKKQIEINPVNDNKKKKKKAKPKMISGTMGTLKKEKNRVKEEEIKKITIYDILTYEEKEKALKIKLLLYLNMYGEDEVRKQAIKKYDVLTSYLESDSSNIKALNVIHRVLETDYPKIPEYIKQKKLV